MAVEIDIEYTGNLYCRATHGPSGQTFVTEAPVDNGGKGEAFSPTDLVATAIGSCFLTIMGLVARRRELKIEGARARVLKDMVADPKRRIGVLDMQIVVPDHGLSDEDKAELEQAARVCPVKQSLAPNVEVRVQFSYDAR